MKLLYCEECGDLVTLRSCVTRSCLCLKYAGKYLDDNLTAVVNEGAILVGIDNNTFVTATQRLLHYRDKLDERVDFFFCGWLPTIPGEVIFVPSFEDVLHYSDHIENTEYKSTMPISKPLPPPDRRIREGEQPSKLPSADPELFYIIPGKVDWKFLWEKIKKFFSLNRENVQER